MNKKVLFYWLIGEKSRYLFDFENLDKLSYENIDHINMYTKVILYYE